MRRKKGDVGENENIPLSCVNTTFWYDARFKTHENSGFKQGHAKTFACTGDILLKNQGKGKEGEVNNNKTKQKHEPCCR